MPTPEPGEVALELRLEGLAISDGVWSMFDPGGVISREPATVIFNAAGAGAALVDMTDPEAVAAAAVASPIRLDDLRIEELILRIGGAELNASGSAVIDNSGPIPAPVGGLDVSLVGALTLLAQLQAAGLIGPEEAAQAPAMLQALAVPGDGPDSFVSRIEFGPGGSVTVNGIPMQ